MILGAMFLVTVVLGVGAFAFIAVKGPALDADSKRFADETIRAIVTQWDVAELEKRATPEFLAVAQKQHVDKLFLMFRRLGTLKDYKGSRGDATMSLTTQHGWVISAAYSGEAEFENGPATIHLRLIQREDQWQILRFEVNSKVFEQS